MKKALAILVFTLLPLHAAASCPAKSKGPDREGYFSSYTAFSLFLDEHAGCKQVYDLLVGVFGSERLQENQIRTIETTLRASFPRELKNTSVIRSEKLGGDFRQEIRSYWVEGQREHLFAYFISHTRSNGKVNVHKLIVSGDINDIFRHWK